MYSTSISETLTNGSLAILKKVALLEGKQDRFMPLVLHSVINGRTPYLGTGGSPWATSNVMAHVSGIYKTNVSVFKQARPGHGYCAKLLYSSRTSKGSRHRKH